MKLKKLSPIHLYAWYKNQVLSVLHGFKNRLEDKTGGPKNYGKYKHT